MNKSLLSKNLVPIDVKQLNHHVDKITPEKDTSLHHYPKITHTSTDNISKDTSDPDLAL